MKNSGVATIAQLHEFDEVIDVRSPTEFAEDHIPGATNCPVLDDAERVRIGTLYQQSPFEAKKSGAALIARNIARHLETHWQQRPKSWHPLIYCWRGGQRSAAMTHVLRQIGFSAERLDGGYKSYRRHVLQQLQLLPTKFSFRVLCGLTGSGKSRLLNVLEQAGAQVLDLEKIACHRGSVLGDLPDEAQPTQKSFDSELLAKLESFDPAIPVYVESESKKMGRVSLPSALLAAMWQSSCLRLECGSALRVALLREDYAHFLTNPDLLRQQLDRLHGMYSNKLLTHWHALCEAQKWDEFIAELLQQHYDPAYTKAITSHYPNYGKAAQLTLKALHEEALHALAQEVLQAP